MRLGRNRSGDRRDDTARPQGGADDLARVVEALEGLPVGVVVEDEDGRTVASNALARSPLNDVQGDALASAVLGRVISAARAGERASETLDLHGSPARVIDIFASRLVSGGVVGVLVDTSERRRLDAVRRDFVANVNHELRTPIGALGLLAEALEEETDPAVVRRLAERISSEAERAGALIEDLLDFSRVDAADSGTRTPVPVDAVVASATERVLAKADRHGVRLQVGDKAGQDGIVAGDRDQLVSAVVNLIDNAVKYSDADSVVDICAAADGGWVDVVVADHGIGIPAKDVDRVFERFYRVDRARDRRTGGTGLGLAIVRHVASNHGGEVRVESHEGMGSTFTLRLPKAQPTTTSEDNGA